MIPLFIGTTELMLIAGIALLLFGGKKLPEMMRGMGKGVNEFKKGMREVSEPIEEVKNVINEATDLSSESEPELRSSETNAQQTI